VVVGHGHSILVSNGSSEGRKAVGPNLKYSQNGLAGKKILTASITNMGEALQAIVSQVTLSEVEGC
jgi:hypothetical protein